ncbi:nuclear transport factor 2 family protein [Achromobacter animicus]|uniref:nuclear transport factor 2 family protein n=1 Tax=Achromobacter animicus TaxID=1389935 RepID=UPI0024469FB7|nr:nuclear transport factor 2 family protein [Achromobacter animicus]MDH0686357.1 nuclear transport factor 2 family protein [Achromobacter animicus]
MQSDHIHTFAAVVYQFFGGLDRRDHVSTSQLMATGGTWQRQGTDLVGPAQVLAALEKRDPRRQTAHLVNNLWVDGASATRARLRYYMTAYETTTAPDGTVSAPQMLGVRDCTDELVLEDGQWRIWWKKSYRLLPAE